METEILSLATIITLCTLSFFTAIISGIFGMIGGVILVVVGTFFVPFDVFLPDSCLCAIGGKWGTGAYGMVGFGQTRFGTV